MVTLEARERTGAPLLSHSPAGWVGIALAALSMLLTLVGGRTTPSDEVDGYGIISALPPLYWVGLVVGLVATVVALRLAIVERPRYALLVPAVWLTAFHIGPHLAHAHLRFPTVWVHLGFVRLIDEQRTGEVLIDARFAWPGFFGTFVAPLAALDEPVLEVVLRLWPAAIIGATAVLVSLLATRSYPTVPLIGPLAAVVYVLLSWTGQDYFSPQSFGYTAYLAMLVLLESGPLRTSSAWSASVPVLARFAAAGGERPVSRTTPVFVVLLILSLGATVSHPLAPFFICTGLVILGLYGRTLAWRLLLMVGLAYLGWFLIAAEPWYSTRIEALVGQIGAFFTNLDRTTTERVVDSSAERVFVTNVRSLVGLSTFVTVLVIGVAMATERFRHLRPAIPLAPLAGIPSLALALQSYGGEIIFRVLLFTLPMAAILIARVLVSFRVRALPVLVPLVVVAMTPLLLLARYGNESFEMVTALDREATQAAYDRADDDTLFVLDSGFLAFRDRTIGRNAFIDEPLRADDDFVARMRAEAREQGLDRVLVVITPSMHQWRTHGTDRPGYLDEMAEWLITEAGATVVFERDRAWVLEL
ncbi:MAG: hypothetical protein AAGA93_10395 [Actinomycetota bacterium]